MPPFHLNTNKNYASGKFNYDRIRLNLRARK